MDLNILLKLTQSQIMFLKVWIGAEYIRDWATRVKLNSHKFNCLTFHRTHLAASWTKISFFSLYYKLETDKLLLNFSIIISNRNPVIFLSFCLFVFLSFCLFVILSFCLLVFMSFCLTMTMMIGEVSKLIMDQALNHD